jgi:hypothetical protein
MWSAPHTGVTVPSCTKGQHNNFKNRSPRRSEPRSPQNHRSPWANDSPDPPPGGRGDKKQIKSVLKHSLAYASPQTSRANYTTTKGKKLHPQKRNTRAGGADYKTQECKNMQKDTRSTISKGIPTQLAGPQPLQKTDDFEGDSDPASWAPNPTKTDDLEGDSDPTSWAPNHPKTDDFEGDSDPASWADSNRENIEIGPPAVLRPAGGQILRLSRLESGRNSAQKPDVRPGRTHRFIVGGFPPP